LIAARAVSRGYPTSPPRFAPAAGLAARAGAGSRGSGSPEPGTVVQFGAQEVWVPILEVLKVADTGGQLFAVDGSRRLGARVESARVELACANCSGGKVLRRSVSLSEDAQKAVDLAGLPSRTSRARTFIHAGAPETSRGNRLPSRRRHPRRAAPARASDRRWSPPSDGQIGEPPGAGTRLPCLSRSARHLRTPASQLSGQKPGRRRGRRWGIAGRCIRRRRDADWRVLAVGAPVLPRMGPPTGPWAKNCKVVSR
jgi:hypothetical protein